MPTSYPLQRHTLPYNHFYIVVSEFMDFLENLESKILYKTCIFQPPGPQILSNVGFICISWHAKSQVKRTLPSRVMTENVFGWDKYFLRLFSYLTLNIESIRSFLNSCLKKQLSHPNTFSVIARLGKVRLTWELACKNIHTKPNCWENLGLIAPIFNCFMKDFGLQDFPTNP